MDALVDTLGTRDAIRLMVFTVAWSIAWVTAPAQLPKRYELPAGLIPFTLFGGRVVAGFFETADRDATLYATLQPALAFIESFVYQIILDVGVTIGMVWIAAAFRIPRSARTATVWLLPLAAALAVLFNAYAAPDADPVTILTPHGAALLVSAVLAALLLFTPSSLSTMERRHAAAAAPLQLLVTLALNDALAALIASLRQRTGAIADLASTNWLHPSIVLVTSTLIAAAALPISPLPTWRSRVFLHGFTAVFAGAIAWRAFV